MLKSPLQFIFTNRKMAWLWLLVRLYVGQVWLEAGWHKVTNPAWVGPQAGEALNSFLQGALKKAGGEHPDVAHWYATFISHVVLPHLAIWSNVVAYGELLVGLGLCLGLLTGLAASFGAFMNLNYLLAGTLSVNPLLLTLGLLLAIAWPIAGLIGLDYYLLPKLGLVPVRKKAR